MKIGNQFYPEDYGAKGDGVNDDSQAIAKAISAAAETNGTVTFSSDTVYYVKQGTPGLICEAGFTLDNVRGLTLEGKNTTIRLGSVIPYFNIVGSADVTLRGFRFEMTPHVAVRGRLVSVNQEQVCAVVTTDEPIPFEGSVYRYYDYTDSAQKPYSFAMPDDQFRNHLFLRQIDRSGPGNTYTVWFSLDRPTRDALKIVEKKRCDIILPTPGVGHRGVAFHIINGCHDIRIEDCDIREGSQFVGAIKGNNGEITFDKVKMCSEDEGDQPLVGWRDGYHCKDNSGAIHWKDCVIGRLYDDAVNISATYLTVSSQPSEYELCLVCMEYNGAYYHVSVGDVLSVYNTFIGKTISDHNKVVEVICQEGNNLCVRVERPVPPVDAVHGRVIFNNRAAPGSTMDGCTVRGTVRMRGPITVRDTRFQLLMMWFENEGYIEGPVPQDVLIENCEFSGTYPVSERYLERYLSFQTLQEWPGCPEYKCRNIRLKNCKMDSQYTYVECGNDVRFENCRELGTGKEIPSHF